MMMKGWIKAVLAGALVNAFVFAAYAMRSGGVALGTRVVGEQHFLEWRSVQMPTTPTAWWINLPYGYISLLAASLAVGSLILSAHERRGHVFRIGRALAIVVCFGAIPIHLTWQLAVSIVSATQ
jgi:hypothetical protein